MKQRSTMPPVTVSQQEEQAGVPSQALVTTVERRDFWGKADAEVIQGLGPGCL
jgi:hypothetical protein